MNNNFTKWFLLCVKDKYADFKGRAHKQEYWMYFLVYITLNFVVKFIGGMIPGQMIGAILSLVVMLALLLPTIAVSIRRLHDIGKSGWWILVSLIPIIGVFYLLFLMTKAGQPEANQWGPNPKS